MQKTKVRKICAVFLLVILYLQAFLYLLMIQPKAAEMSYSSPIEDLTSSGNFDLVNYPENSNDYSLDVIALGEGANGELFIYVYQPCAMTKLLLATSINIDSPLNDDRNFKNYKLSLIASQGVIQKYLVNGFVLREGDIRKYSISSIYRAFDSGIDTDPGNGNTISEKAYPVGKLWTLSEGQEGVATDIVYEDVISVDQKHVGFVKYKVGSDFNGLFGISDDVQSHYIAFKTNRKIDEIIEVDISFNHQKRISKPSDTGLRVEETSEDPVPEILTLSKDEVLEVNTSGFFPKNYKYKRIQSVSSFLEMEEQDIEDTSVLEGKEWIIRFYETEFKDNLRYENSAIIGTWSGSREQTFVTDVALFRIEYLYDQVKYNLGVVDDKQTGSGMPDGSHGELEFRDFENFFKELMKIFGILIAVFFVIVLWGPISIVLKLIWTAIKMIFELLLNIITLPFRLIFGFFRR